ncbi:MAG: hypothetical protein HKN45_02275 [Flavobacteriales bacterium]|nr:hypothetical protein [Flavobacteriales bacterium]
MRRSVLFFTTVSFIIIFSLVSNAQKDKNWLDVTMQPCKKGKAYYYLSHTPMEDGQMVKMYDLADRLRMKGFTEDKRGEIYDGPFEFYYANGNVESRGQYIKNQKVGLWERYDTHGNKLAERMYAAYNPMKQAFYYVDEMPSYEGGDENFLNFLKHKLKPIVDQSRYSPGDTDIEVGFVVSEKGFIESFELVKGLDEEWNEKALKELNAMPLWEPGKKSGENVRVWMQLTLDLSL